MTFEEALKVVDDNKQLIGKRYCGAVIDEFLIVPTNPEQYKNYYNLYIQTLNAQASVVPFINCDLDILVVCDKKRITQEGTFMSLTLSNLLSRSNEIE